MSIRRKIRDWLLQDDTIRLAKEGISRGQSSRIHRAPNFVIKTHAATGGTIVEVQKVSLEDRFEDQPSTLYIISDKQEFGESLAKILTLEALR